MEDALAKGRGRAFGDVLCAVQTPLGRSVAIRAERKDTQRTTKLPSQDRAIWATPCPSHLAPLVGRCRPSPNLPHLVTEENLGTRGASWSSVVAGTRYD